MRTNIKMIKNFFAENGTVAAGVKSVIFPKGTKFKTECVSETSTSRQLFCNAKVVIVDKYCLTFDRNCIEKFYYSAGDKAKAKWIKMKDNCIKLSLLTDDQLSIIIKNLKA